MNPYFMKQNYFYSNNEYNVQQYYGNYFVSVGAPLSSILLEMYLIHLTYCVFE